MKFIGRLRWFLQSWCAAACLRAQPKIRRLRSSRGFSFLKSGLDASDIGEYRQILPAFQGRKEPLDRPARAFGWALALAVLPLTACSSLSLTDAVPTSAQSSVRSTTQPDGYPNLNIRMPAATDQITDSEREQLTEELANSRQRQRNGADRAEAAAQAEALRLLRRSHAGDRLRAIEAAQEQE